MTYQQFTEKLFAEAAKAGIAPCEVYYSESDNIKVTTLQQKLETFAVSSTAGLSFRGMVNGRMGYASTEALDEDAVTMLVRAVRESAMLVEDEEVQEIFAGSPEYAQVETYSPELDAIGAAQYIEDAITLEREGVSRHPEVRESDFNQSGYDHTRISIRNSFGLNLTHQDNSRYHYISLVGRRGERAANGSVVWAGRETNPDLTQKYAEGVDYAVRMLEAEPVASGKMPVVLRNEAMTEILACFCGSFSAEAAQKGLSLLKGREGEMIAAECVTIMDDPLLPGGMSSSPFDAEGVATYTKEVIGKGKLNTLLHNLKTARVDGVKSTGNAAKGAYSAPVRVAPSNFFIVPGKDSLEELLSRMGNGMLITELSGLHSGANEVSGDFSLLSKGFVVENGKITRAVEQITVAGNFYTLLKDVLAIANDPYKGFSGIVSPSVYVRELSIAGK